MSDATQPEIREDGNAIIIKLEQDQLTNHENIATFGNAVYDQIRQATPTEGGARRAIIIDCTDVSTLSQPVRGVFLHARHEIENNDSVTGKLILAGVRREDRVIMNVDGTSRAFTLTNSLEEALEIAHKPETPESELPDAPDISENGVENKR